MALDMLTVLSELQVHEVNNSYIQQLIDNGSITDVNNTLIVQIGEFWANGNETLARDFAMNVSEGMLPEFFGYSIIMDNDTIYARPNNVKNLLVSSKKIITGIQKSKPIKGFIARARATTVSKTTSLVVPFAPAGAGWKGSTSDPGILEVVKVFELPDVNILEAKAYLSLHLDRGSTDWNVVTINKGQCNITRNDMDLGPGSEGVFRVFQLSPDCFNVGNNTIREALQTLGWEHSERVYFDNVNSTQGGGVSGAGPWVITPFYIPAEATDISVSIQIAGRGIYDYTGSCTPSRSFWGWGSSHCKRDYDYIIFLNSNTPFDNDATPDTDPLYFYSPQQTAPYIVDGTNIIAVYFNNYEDNYWGEGTEIIYSDPINDPGGSSYVEVNYSSPPAVPYGVIEVRQIKEFGGEADPPKDSNFSFPSEAEGVSSVFVHPVELYSYITRVYSDTGYPPSNLVFESPSSRAVPSSVYIPLWTLDTTPLALNYERLQETSGNDVLPNSTIDYGFYIRGFIGYGQVFSTQSESVDDAIARLQEVLGSYVNATDCESVDDAIARLQEVLGSYVNATDLVIDNTTMSGVPSLWGPAVAEVRVWD
jgi:predicted RNase H-like HicB family nuclease